MEVQETSPKGDHLSIKITNVESVDILVSSIKQKLESVSLSHTISRVPEQLSKETEQLYNPTIVSIGPLHHDKHCLKSMEDKKWRYFNTLLSRQTNSESTLQSCITLLKHSEQKARMFYGENIKKGSDQFVEMLLLDGCFIIELFLEYSIKNFRRRDDPFFSSNDTIFHLRCDLILFENQLPFFILDQIFNLVSIPKQTSISLTGLALRFFKKLIPIDHSKCSHQQDLISKPLHFLDLIRQLYLPTYQGSPSLTLADTQTKEIQVQIQISGAMEISALGIRIEKNISESPSNIAFDHQKLKIPSLEIHTYTEILFRNLIAMELCQPKCSKQITSYVILMGQLIQSKRDVGLLQDKGILVQDHYTQWDIVLLFKRLFVEINMKDFYYRGICEKINGFQPRRRRAFWENMRNIYHGTHFGIAGFCLAALFLVFLFTGALFGGVTFLLHHFQ